MFRFEILCESPTSGARVGRIHTPHGIIDTPGFVAVGTNGTLKALDSRQVIDSGLQLMFCNTYHLLLQPGTEVVRHAGGLHKFMNRPFPLITDSGGFQVFSLAYGSISDELKGKGGKKQEGHVLKIDEEGVLFRSYRNGDKILLTPESSIAAQKAFGADIILPLDELPPYHTAKDDLYASWERTHRWEKRSLAEHLKNPQNQAIYSIIHGGIDPVLRRRSCETLSSLPFDGHAIGGSLGKTHEEMGKMLSETVPYLPREKPRHLLGIGDLFSIQACIPLGIDTFDSSYPTRAARHGLLFTRKGNLKIEKKEHEQDLLPIEIGCPCPTCKHFSKSYLHHLFKAKELTAYSLASIHNLYFMVDLMRQIREDILTNTPIGYTQEHEANRLCQPQPA